jgi:hypothetical protein
MKINDLGECEGIDLYTTEDEFRPRRLWYRITHVYHPAISPLMRLEMHIPWIDVELIIDLNENQ